MRIDLGDSKREQGKRKQFECIFKRSAIGNVWKERVLLAGFGVGARLEGSYGAFDC
jgi:hypothetical protein